MERRRFLRLNIYCLFLQCINFISRSFKYASTKSQIDASRINMYLLLINSPFNLIVHLREKFPVTSHRQNDEHACYGESVNFYNFFLIFMYVSICLKYRIKVGKPSLKQTDRNTDCEKGELYHRIYIHTR